MIGKKINQLATELAPVSTDLTIIGDPISGVSKKITLAQLGAIFSGAVSFYTNLAGFPATGDINVIYCAKDTQKLYLWSGSAYTEVFPSQALLDTYQLRSEKGVSNGYASLDSGGKVPISQLPSSIMEYKGTWNAATNTPTLANGTGDTGDVYICNVAGTVNFGAGPLTFAVGDYVIYSGSIWQRSSGAVGTVTSVAASITGNAIGITGSPVTTSGTLAFAFAGTGAQYIKGDGTLATFPSTISQAEKLITEVYNRTGATLTKGTIVYINGGQGNLPTVTKALATGDSTSAQTFGVVQADITNMNNGYVVVAGKLSDLDTQAYTEGTQLYLSATTAGTWTSTKQYAPNHLVYVGIVVRSHPTQGVVEVKIMNGFEIDELHNVAAQTPTNNDGLFWESSTSLWKNKSIATVLGYTPQPQLSGTGFVKISGTTISYDNSTYLTTSAAASTYLPMVLSSTANSVDINGQQFSIYGSAGGFTSGRIIVDPVFSAIGYQNAGVFDGLKILTNGNAEFTNSGVTRFFNQVRFDSTLTNGTYTYTLPGATGTIALVGGAGVGTVTSVGLSSATSGVTIGSTPITTSGTITLAIATASGSQQGLLSSTDWTTFNNKQNALTNPVTGTGTTNYLPKFTGTSTIGNSAVFESGGNVGIGTTSPSTKLHIGGVGSAISFDTTGATATSIIQTVSDFELSIKNNRGTSSEIIVGNEVLSFKTNSAERMRLNASGNLGLGNSAPEVKFDVLGAGTVQSRVQSTSGGDIRFSVDTVGRIGTYSVSPLLILTSGTERMRIDTAGNLGLGVSPSAWSSPFIAFQLGTFNQYIAGQTNAADMKLGTNHYYGSGDYRYGNSTDRAARYDIGKDGFFWQIAPSGTAGNAISFTQAMTLDASGNLLLGTTSPLLSSSGRGNITINGSSSSILAFGIASALSGYIYSSSSNLELDAGGARFMQFNTNNTERMRITSGGNVGIGTTAPSRLFHAAGQGRFDGNLLISADAGNEQLVIQRGSNNNAQLIIGYHSSGYGRIQAVEQNVGYKALALNQDGGNVGIGTTSISNAISGTETVLKISNSNVASLYLDSTGTGKNYAIFSSAFGNLTFYDTTAGSERMRIKSNGIINLSNVPTSSAGLSSGDIYKTVAGVLMIV